MTEMSTDRNSWTWMSHHWNSLAESARPKSHV